MHTGEHMHAILEESGEYIGEHTHEHIHALGIQVSTHMLTCPGESIPHIHAGSTHTHALGIQFHVCMQVSTQGNQVSTQVNPCTHKTWVSVLHTSTHTRIHIAPTLHTSEHTHPYTCTNIQLPREPISFQTIKGKAGMGARQPLLVSGDRVEDIEGRGRTQVYVHVSHVFHVCYAGCRKPPHGA